MFRRLPLGTMLVLGLLLPAVAVAADSTLPPRAAERSQEAGGLIVYAGDAAPDAAFDLAAESGRRLQLLLRDADALAKAKQAAGERKRLGQLSVTRWSDAARLPYIDNLVNLLILDAPGALKEAEILRVLAPRGVALVGEGDAWRTVVKPVPQEIDDWTHYLHSPSGNAVAQDTIVGPPEHLQWVGNPLWSRHHDRMASMSAMVSAKGRLFYIMDEGSRYSIQMPADWKLIARDAFNGVTLWKRQIGSWHSHLWPLKSGPTQLARRLVSDGETVFATLALEAPVTAIDADTGKTLKTFEQTKSTEEILLMDGMLVLCVNPGKVPLADFAPQLNTGDQGRVAQQWRWDAKPRRIMAVDPQTGQTLWTKDTRVSPLTLAADSDQVVFHDGEKVVALNRADGKEQWTTQPAGQRENVTYNFGSRLVIYEDVVLFAGGDRTMRAYDAASGKQLWQSTHARSGYQSPEDLLVTGGLVWVAPTTSGRDTGIFTGRDPRTGEVKVEFPPNVETYWFHHRCHIAKATENYLIPSRTGIEFVDFKQKNWDINHWVRGGCLYGVLPANGLLYAPPHDCACYTETKLSGMNALAPARKSAKLPPIDEASRLEKGAAYGEPVESAAQPTDWPTYRHDGQRSGATGNALSTKLTAAWTQQLEAPLTSVSVAGGMLYVAEVDKHTLHALDAATGNPVWQFTIGARLDSPPTYHEGRLYFGGRDGYVYCLRARDGAEIWRYRAAPTDQRLMAFEQVESVWPIHGTVLIEQGVAWCCAGRSSYLDGGLRVLRLDPITGQKLTETKLDSIDPETGEDLQNRIQILNMPVGLPDIMSSDGKHVYMRSQPFDLDGKRGELGPNSGNPVEQGRVQSGETAHLFSPTGYLDDSWFHRSYWVYGRSFAGGHSGYYQAGRFAPAGRLLVFDQDTIYGFGRKPEYLKWTTTLEHQLFASDRQPPETPQGGRSIVTIANTAKNNPAGKPVTVEAWVRVARGNGVVLARGGPAEGYALWLSKNRPVFSIRSGEQVVEIRGRQLTKEWTHLVGVLDAKAGMRLYVNGKLAASGEAPALISKEPAQTLDLGADDKGAVGSYKSPHALAGLIDSIAVYHTALTPEQIAARAEKPTAEIDAAAIIEMTFDNGKATDISGNKHHGQAEGVSTVDGQTGKAALFRGVVRQAGGSFVQRKWTREMPLLVRAMVLAGDLVWIAGPPDVTDEEETFRQLTERSPQVQALLAKQDAALDGKHGGKLLAVHKRTGEVVAEFSIDALPAWDGMAAAGNRLYLSTSDGRVLCWK